MDLLISVIKQKLRIAYLGSFAYLYSLNYLEVTETVNASMANAAIWPTKYR
jgi:hypothetical protein